MDDSIRLLLVLSKEGCMTLSEVSRRLYVGRDAAEAILNGLIERGKVVKTRAPGGVLYCFPDSGRSTCPRDALMSALLEVLKGHRGRYAAIRPIKLAKRCAWGYPTKGQIAAAARFLAQYRHALVDRRKWLFDLEKLRRYISA